MAKFMASKLRNPGQKRAFNQISRGWARLLAQSETGQAPSLRTGFWRAFSEVVFWERGGKSGLSWAGRLDRIRPGLLRIAGWAFDSMTGKGGGYEFDQVFHRGS
jgi:hypothetical protein